MTNLENRFIILKVNAKKCFDSDILLNIRSKNDLVNALVRKEVFYYKVNSIKYSVFISDMKNNPFIGGHIKHINIFMIYH